MFVTELDQTSHRSENPLLTWTELDQTYSSENPLLTFADVNQTKEF